MGNFYTLNWPTEAPLRTAYLAQVFQEFFADQQFILMVDPEGLRAHIEKLDTVPQLMYENIVRELLKYLKP